MGQRLPRAMKENVMRSNGFLIPLALDQTLKKFRVGRTAAFRKTLSLQRRKGGAVPFLADI